MAGQTYEQKREEERRAEEEKRKEEKLQERIYELGKKITGTKDTISRIPQTKQVQELIKADTTIEAISSVARLSETLLSGYIDLRELVSNFIIAIEDIQPKTA